MRIAMPVQDGKLCSHFGHAPHFALVEVDPAEKRILNVQNLSAPPHAAGVLPDWLHRQGVEVVLVGGIGARAKNLLEQHGITVLAGVPIAEPTPLVQAYLQGSLLTAENMCDH